MCSKSCFKESLRIACSMDKCLIAGRVQKVGDRYYSTLVQCEGEGSEGTCGKMLHPVCTITTPVLAHAYCCRFVLHDHTTLNRLYLCDTCASYSSASNGGHL